MSNRIIVEVTGGVAVIDHSNHPVTVILADWDAIKQGGDIRTMLLSGVPDRVFDERRLEIEMEANRVQYRDDPELLPALIHVLARLKAHTSNIETCDLPSGTELAIEQAESAIAKSQGDARAQAI